MSSNSSETVAQPLVLGGDALATLQTVFGGDSDSPHSDCAVTVLPSAVDSDVKWRKLSQDPGIRRFLDHMHLPVTDAHSVRDCLCNALPGPELPQHLVSELLRLAIAERLDVTLAQPYDSPLWIAVAHPKVHQISRQSLAGSGVGATPHGALMRCLLELGECASMRTPGYTQRMRANQATLGAAAITPDSLSKLSKRQSRQSGTTRRTWGQSVVEWIAVNPLHDSARIEQRYVAAECVVPGWPSPHAEFAVDSGGCAAARNSDEAIAHGLFELIERDAAAIWWYNALSRPRVDWRSLLECSDAAGAGDDTRLVASWCHARGHRFFVLDLTHDIRVPVYCAISGDPDGTLVALGFGCHLNPLAALNHACREMVQQRVRLWSSRALSAKRQDGMHVDPLTRRWLSEVHIDRCPQLESGTSYSIPINAKYSTGTDQDRTGLRHRVVAELARAGVNCYWVQLRYPSYDIPAVRCIAPSLRSLRPCFGPGRLFDVPVALGWLAEPRRETEMARIVTPT